MSLWASFSRPRAARPHHRRMAANGSAVSAQDLAARQVYKVNLFAHEAVYRCKQIFIIRCLFGQINLNTKTRVGTAKQNRTDPY
jgi:hypothetical protein